MELNTENLNYLLGYVLPLEEEKKFHDEVRELAVEVKEDLKFPSLYYKPSANGYLEYSVTLISRVVQELAKSSLTYQLADNARDRAVALMDETLHSNEFIQKVFDLRMAMFKDKPELELLFLNKVNE